MAQLRTVKGPDACWVSGPFCFAVGCVGHWLVTVAGRVIPAMRGMCLTITLILGHPRCAGLPVAAPSGVVYCRGVGVGLPTCFFNRFNALCFSRVRARAAASRTGLPSHVLYHGLFVCF